MEILLYGWKLDSAILSIFYRKCKFRLGKVRRKVEVKQDQSGNLECHKVQYVAHLKYTGPGPSSTSIWRHCFAGQRLLAANSIIYRVMGGGITIFLAKLARHRKQSAFVGPTSRQSTDSVTLILCMTQIMIDIDVRPTMASIVPMNRL